MHRGCSRGYSAATGVVSTARSCRGPGSDGGTQLPLLPEDRPGLGRFIGPSAGDLLGSFFEGDPFGVAASVLSLTTNVVSTCLIGWQAWYGHNLVRSHTRLCIYRLARKHRALVRGNGLKSYLGRSQVSRALALLIESGVFYSVIWVRSHSHHHQRSPVTNGILIDFRRSIPNHHLPLLRAILPRPGLLIRLSRFHCRLGGVHRRSTGHRHRMSWRPSLQLASR